MEKNKITTKQIKTEKELLKYCFYVFNNKLNFGFNECWDIEKDKNISKELINKIKNICPNWDKEFKF